MRSSPDEAYSVPSDRAHCPWPGQSETPTQSCCHYRQHWPFRRHGNDIRVAWGSFNRCYSSAGIFGSRGAGATVTDIGIARSSFDRLYGSARVFTIMVPIMMMASLMMAVPIVMSVVLVHAGGRPPHPSAVTAPSCLCRGCSEKSEKEATATAAAPKVNLRNMVFCLSWVMKCPNATRYLDM